MKGYNHPFRGLGEIKETDYYVGCRSCWTTWYEKRMMHEFSPRINGPDYCYDYCDACKDKKNEAAEQITRALNDVKK